MNKFNNLDNPSIIALEKKEDEFIQILSSFKSVEQQLQTEAQQGNFNNKQQLLEKLQSLLLNLENVLNEMQQMIKQPFDKGLANENVSEITSTQLLHQSFNLDKSVEIYNKAKDDYESLIGERDNTSISVNSNKSLFYFWFLLSILLIILLILHLNGYNIFNNYLIYFLFGFLIYLYFNSIKAIFNYIKNFFISIWNTIISIIRLFS